jgi:hypothetical protein
LKFYNRTSVDLKDRWVFSATLAHGRFRTYFPEDYKRLYPNATSTRERAHHTSISTEAASFAKAKRKDRLPFTKPEDDNLLIGFGKYGGKWSSIQKDPDLGLTHRRSTDLRDRFRNAFPEKYIGAGFKPPPMKRRRRDIEGNETSPVSADDGQNLEARTFEFRTEVAPAPVVLPEAREVPVPEQTSSSTTGLASSQPTTSETFSSTRLGWGNSLNSTRLQEREMAIKIRRALEMSNESEMMGEQEIPLDPGLSDVAYQPHEGSQTQDTETLTGLLDAAVQQRSWKRE